MKRILITGAAGFIGSTLVDTLLRRGDEIHAIDNFCDYYDPAIKRANLALARTNDRFHLYEADICDADTVNRLFARAEPEVVVHLAAQAGVRFSLENPKYYYRVNIEGSQNILDAFRAVRPSHLVFASSSSVYGGITDVPFLETMDISRPISPYAASKRMNELMCHAAHHVDGLKVSLLRFFTAYGPRQRPDMAIAKFAELILRDQPIPVYGDGTTSRDYTYIEDIIDGVVRAVDTPLEYEIFNLGRSDTVTLANLIEILAKHLGREVRTKQMPLQPGDVLTTYADVTKARDLLGYVPRVSIDEGIARYVQWVADRGGRLASNQ